MNNQTWSSAGKHGLYLAIPAIAAYLLSNYLQLPSVVNMFIWIAKISLSMYLLVRLTRNYSADLQDFPYKKAFGYGIRMCLFSTIICTAFYALDLFVIRPDLLSETITMTLEMAQEQGLSVPGMDYDALMKTLPTTLIAVYFCYLMVCGLIFSAIAASRTKHEDTPFENTFTATNE